MEMKVNTYFSNHLWKKYQKRETPYPDCIMSSIALSNLQGL